MAFPELRELWLQMDECTLLANGEWAELDPVVWEDRDGAQCFCLDSLAQPPVEAREKTTGDGRPAYMAELVAARFKIWARLAAEVQKAAGNMIKLRFQPSRDGCPPELFAQYAALAATVPVPAGLGFRAELYEATVGMLSKSGEVAAAGPCERRWRELVFG